MNLVDAFRSCGPGNHRLPADRLSARLEANRLIADELLRLAGRWLLTFPPQVREDAVQQVYLKLLQGRASLSARGQIDSEPRVRGFLRTAVRHEAVTITRSSQKERPLTDAGVEPGEASGPEWAHAFQRAVLEEMVATPLSTPSRPELPEWEELDAALRTRISRLLAEARERLRTQVVGGIAQSIREHDRDDFLHAFAELDDILKGGRTRKDLINQESGGADGDAFRRARNRVYKRHQRAMERLLAWLNGPGGSLAELDREALRIAIGELPHGTRNR